MCSTHKWILYLQKLRFSLRKNLIDFGVFTRQNLMYTWIVWTD